MGTSAPRNLACEIAFSRVQALERAEEYARRAVEAAVKLVRRQRALAGSRPAAGQTLTVG